MNRPGNAPPPNQTSDDDPALANGLPAGVPTLSEREREVLELVAAGMSNRQIARELILAVGTVKTHIHNISAKLNASNRTQAVAHARVLHLLADGPTSAAADNTSTVLPPVNPYKGLQAFEESDAEVFFGREGLVDQIVARLRESEAHFLAIVGPSGSGKSSAVKAGLLPALRRGAIPGSERWIITDMTPGSHPLEELEIALLQVAGLLRAAADPPATLLPQLREDERGLVRAVRRILPPDGETDICLLIDQFEELFTQVSSEQVRAHFLHSLYQTMQEPRCRLRIIVTLRADYFDRPLLYADMGALFQARSVIVLPLTPHELERAIVGPLERVGVQAENGLVATIVSDVNEQPGALPMLQYALTELFEQQADRTLTLAAYHANGGVPGALARRADALYAELSTQEQEVARQLFLRLITFGEGTEATRRRVAWDELIAIAPAGKTIPDEETIRRIARRFGRFRLLTFDHDPVTGGPAVEVAHEALLHEWGQYRVWLEESRADVRAQRRLAAAAAEWQGAGCETSYLLRGAQLAQFEAWAEATTIHLRAEPRNFLAASIDRRAQEETERQAQRARQIAFERRDRQRLLTIVAILAVATVLALVLSMATFNQTRIAQDALNSEQQARATADANRILARREAEVSRSLALLANTQLALNANNTELALALALQAARINDPPAAVQAMLSEAVYAPGTRRVLLPADEERSLVKMALSPDGEHALLALLDGRMLLLDVATGETQATLQGHASAVMDVTFSPDGAQALSSSEDGNIILWDLATQTIVRRLRGHDDVVTGAVFSADGMRALSGSFDGTMILWNLANGAIIQRFTGHEDSIFTVALGPNGRLALSGSKDGTARLWDTLLGAELRRLPGQDLVTNVAFSPDGRRAYVVYGGCLRMWDTLTGQLIREIDCGGRESPTKWGVAINADGRTVLTSASDGSVQLWDMASGEELLRLLGHKQSVNSVAFLPDDRSALTGSSDGSLRLWDLHNGAETRRINGPVLNSAFTDVAYTPDGAALLAGVHALPGNAADTSLILYDAATGTEIQRFYGHEQSVNSVAISPDGRYALSGSDDSTVFLWDIASGGVIQRMDGHDGPVREVIFSPDGAAAFSISGRSDVPNVAENRIVQWDLTTGQPLKSWISDEREVHSVAVSPDGSLLAVGGINSLRLWDITTGEVVQRLRVSAGEAGPSTINSMVFSPDGSTLLLGSSNTLVELWDVQTGELRRRFSGHTDAVRGVVFSPDGTQALSGADDRTIILWDVAEGAALRRYSGHTGAIIGVALAEGGAAASVSWDNTLRQWTITDSLVDLTDWARTNRYVRDLLPEERIHYGVTLPGIIEGEGPY